MRLFLRIWPILLTIIITVPAFLSLINGQYFTMHDDQHIARLYLLDQGIRQGYLYPRWVDMLGFGYGYPLFNFYPPLIYYVAEFFHLIGFSLIWAVKLTFITGFVLSAVGMYLFARKFMGKLIAFVPATLYTYFFYHAVTAYVRGALAEFFSMAILPFVFLTIKNLAEERTLKNSALFGITLALLILTHPLIAFPSLIFIGAFFLFYFMTRGKHQFAYAKLFIIGGMIGLALSAFFWMPSMMEKKYTYVDKILTNELANYRIHYIYPQQFLYSLWGYGGSIDGPQDGMTFQLGKIHIALFIVALFLSYFYLKKTKKHPESKEFYFFAALALLSIFMTTQAASFIWDRISYLWYLQFPWRFLTFAGLFIAIVGGYAAYFLKELYFNHPKKNSQVVSIVVIVICLATVLVYGKYFKPQSQRDVTDRDLTTHQEISWRISKTSFEFVPQGVRTTKTALDTTTLDIKENDLPKTSYVILNGEGYGKELSSNSGRKRFYIHAVSDIVFRVNTYYFPGWDATLKDIKTDRMQDITIRDDNDLRLMTFDIPKGMYELTLEFNETPLRMLADIISIVAISSVIAYLLLARFKLIP